MPTQCGNYRLENQEGMELLGNSPGRGIVAQGVRAIAAHVRPTAHLRQEVCQVVLGQWPPVLAAKNPLAAQVPVLLQRAGEQSRQGHVPHAIALG
jgi:hypothetical protein